MAFTAKLGTNLSYLANIELGLGANPTPYFLFSGIYTITPEKTNDTLYLNINYPSFSTITVQIINPFVEMAYIGDQAVVNPYGMQQL